MRRSRTGARGRIVAFIATLAFLATFGVALPSTAQAAPVGTIVYIKNHNIWFAKGDGTAQVQVTKDGTAASPYASPTQADDGTLVASKSYLVVRLDRNGKQLGWFSPPTLTSSAGAPLGGVPQHVAVSPNGATIAYSQVAYQCPIGVSCAVRYATGYTSTSGAAKGNTTYFTGASWISNTRTIQSGGYGSQAMLHTLGSAPVNWFNDEDAEDLAEFEVSRDGKWLIGLRSYGSGTHVIWYQVSGNPSTQSPPTAPSPKCVTGTDPSFASPTLAPDGSAAAWEESDGIWIKNDLTSCTGTQPALRIPGGSNPSWSAVAYRAPTVATPPKPGNKPATKKALKIKTAPKVSGKAKVGKTLKVSKGKWNVKPKKLRFQWYRGKKKIKGATKAKYKVKRADRGKRLRVKVTVKRSGYKTASKFTKYTAKVKR